MRRELFMLLLALFLVGCSGDEQPAHSSVRPKAPTLERESFDSNITESAAGVKQWVLHYHKLQKFAGEREVLLMTVKMDFYREGAYFSTLTSDSGRADLRTKDVHTWGNVVVVTEDGRKLETEELFFDNETQLITNDVFDRFTRGNDVITGIGLEATPDLEYIEIKQSFVGDIEDAAEEGGGS